jgi:hypothetical protein
VCVIPSLTSCSNTYQTSNTILPPKVNVNTLFDFKKYDENENTIYPKLKENQSELTSFISKPNNLQIRSLLHNYLVEGYDFSYVSAGIDINVSQTSATFKITPTSDSVLFSGEVSCGFPLMKDNLKDLMDLPKTVFGTFEGVPTKDQFLAACATKGYDTNQIEIGDITMINDKSYAANITPISGSNIYKGLSFVKINKIQNITDIVTSNVIGTVKLEDSETTPEIQRVRDKIADLFPITCDAELANHIIYSTGSFTNINTYEKKVNIKFDDMYSEEITGEMEIELIPLKEGQFIYKSAFNKDGFTIASRVPVYSEWIVLPVDDGSTKDIYINQSKTVVKGG